MQTSEVVTSALSMRAYARRRGTSVESVRRAVKSGRIRKSLVMEGGSAKIADPDLADREWAANTDLTKAPVYVKERNGLPATTSEPVTPVTDETVTPVTNGSDDDETERLTLSDASAREKAWKAKLAELDYKRKAGELVPKDDVRGYKAACEARQVDEYTRVRNAILGIATKVKHQLPHLAHRDILVIDGLLRGALDVLATPDGAAA